MPSKHGDGWSARWIDHEGRRRRATFRFRRDAETYERKMKGEQEEARRGLRGLPPPHKPFESICSYWLEHRASQKRSGFHDESIIRAHLRPAFGALMLHEISVVHIDKFIVERAHLNKKTVANHLTLLGSMLNVAKEIGWLTVVPRIRKPRVRIFSADFSYLRTDEEVRRFLVAANEEARVTLVMYSVAIYTGMRAGELAGLHWGDVSFEGRLITVQRSFSGPTKAEDVRYVPILDPLLPLLREHRLATAGRLVFPNEAGEMFDRSARVFQETFHRVLKRAALPEIERSGKKRRYIRFHDLRHTFASHWVMKGGDLFKLQKILGHKTVQMTMRYAHLAPHAFSEDFQRFGSSSLVMQANVEPIAVMARPWPQDGPADRAQERVPSSALGR
jgi:integrase